MTSVLVPKSRGFQTVVPNSRHFRSVSQQSCPNPTAFPNTPSQLATATSPVISLTASSPILTQAERQPPQQQPTQITSKPPEDQNYRDFPRRSTLSAGVPPLQEIIATGNNDEGVILVARDASEPGARNVSSSTQAADRSSVWNPCSGTFGYAASEGRPSFASANSRLVSEQRNESLEVLANVKRTEERPMTSMLSSLISAPKPRRSGRGCMGNFCNVSRHSAEGDEVQISMQLSEFSADPELPAGLCLRTCHDKPVSVSPSRRLSGTKIKLQELVLEKSASASAFKQSSQVQESHRSRSHHEASREHAPAKQNERSKSREHSHHHSPNHGSAKKRDRKSKRRKLKAPTEDETIFITSPSKTPAHLVESVPIHPAKPFAEEPDTQTRLLISQYVQQLPNSGTEPSTLAVPDGNVVVGEAQEMGSSIRYLNVRTDHLITNKTAPVISESKATAVDTTSDIPVNTATPIPLPVLNFEADKSGKFESEGVPSGVQFSYADSSSPGGTYLLSSMLNRASPAFIFSSPHVAEPTSAITQPEMIAVNQNIGLHPSSSAPNLSIRELVATGGKAKHKKKNKHNKDGAQVPLLNPPDTPQENTEFESSLPCSARQTLGSSPDQAATNSDSRLTKFDDYFTSSIIQDPVLYRVDGISTSSQSAPAVPQLGSAGTRNSMPLSEGPTIYGDSISGDHFMKQVATTVPARRPEFMGPSGNTTVYNNRKLRNAEKRSQSEIPQGPVADDAMSGFQLISDLRLLGSYRSRLPLNEQTQALAQQSVSTHRSTVSSHMNRKVTMQNASTEDHASSFGRWPTYTALEPSSFRSYSQPQRTPVQTHCDFCTLAPETASFTSFSDLKTQYDRRKSDTVSAVSTGEGWSSAVGSRFTHTGDLSNGPHQWSNRTSTVWQKPGSHIRSFSVDSPNFRYVTGHSRVIDSEIRELREVERRVIANNIVSSTTGHVDLVARFGERVHRDEFGEFVLNFVEVPIIEEVVREVKKLEIKEKIVEKKIPQVEYVDKIVEVPEIQYVDKLVEVDKIETKIINVPIKKVIDVPKEVIKFVNVPKTVERIQEKKVPGEVIEVPKPYKETREVISKKFIHQPKPTVIAQSFHPVVTNAAPDDSACCIDVETKIYNFVPMPVDIYIPLPVKRELWFTELNLEHREVPLHFLPIEQQNSLIKAMNPELNLDEAVDMFNLVPRGTPALNEEVKLVDLGNLGLLPLRIGPGTDIVEPSQNLHIIRNDLHCPSSNQASSRDSETQMSYVFNTPCASPNANESGREFLRGTSPMPPQYGGRTHLSVPPLSRMFGQMPSSAWNGQSIGSVSSVQSPLATPDAISAFQKRAKQNAFNPFNAKSANDRTASLPPLDFPRKQKHRSQIESFMHPAYCTVSLESQKNFLRANFSAKLPGPQHPPIHGFRGNRGRLEDLSADRASLDTFDAHNDRWNRDFSLIDTNNHHFAIAPEAVHQKAIFDLSNFGNADVARSTISTSEEGGCGYCPDGGPRATQAAVLQLTPPSRLGPSCGSELFSRGAGQFGVLPGGAQPTKLPEISVKSICLSELNAKSEQPSGAAIRGRLPMLRNASRLNAPPVRTNGYDQKQCDLQSNSSDSVTESEAMKPDDEMIAKVLMDALRRLRSKSKNRKSEQSPDSRNAQKAGNKADTSHIPFNKEATDKQTTEPRSPLDVGSTEDVDTCSDEMSGENLPRQNEAGLGESRNSRSPEGRSDHLKPFDPSPKANGCLDGRPWSRSSVNAFWQAVFQSERQSAVSNMSSQEASPMFWAAKSRRKDSSRAKFISAGEARGRKVDAPSNSVSGSAIGGVSSVYQSCSESTEREFRVRRNRNLSQEQIFMPRSKQRSIAYKYSAVDSQAVSAWRTSRSRTRGRMSSVCSERYKEAFLTSSPHHQGWNVKFSAKALLH